MKGLTTRQLEIVELIQKHIAEFGRPPTRAEIAQHFGFRSVNAAEDHLQALAKKNIISVESGTSRGIRLLGAYALQAQPQSEFHPESLRTSDKTSSNEDAFFELPLLGKVAAGSPMLSEAHVQKHLTLPKNLFSGHADYLLQVRGLSMQNIGIFDGDLLAVQKAQAGFTPKSGQVVVARLNHEVTVKRFYKRKTHVELHSENPEFKPIVVNPNQDELDIEGIPVGLIRNQSHQFS